MRRLHLGIVCLIVADIGGTPTATAGGPPVANPTILDKHGPVTLTTTAPLADGRLNVAFTDRVAVTVDVAGTFDLKVKPPERWVDEPWHVSRVESPQVDKLDAARARWSQRLWLEPLAPGEALLQLAPLQYRDGGGSWQSVTWRPITVNVTSRLKQPDLGSARDITSIEEVAAAAPRRMLWLAVAAAFASAIVLAIGWRRLRRRRTAASRAPEAWALADLDRLTALRLAERGKSERFATLLSGLVRRYAERKYGVPARRQTTAEFLESLPPDLGEQRSWLEGLLHRCDQIKFAPIDARADECGRLAASVRTRLAQSASGNNRDGGG